MAEGTALAATGVREESVEVFGGLMVRLLAKLLVLLDMHNWPACVGAGGLACVGDCRGLLRGGLLRGGLAAPDPALAA